MNYIPQKLLTCSLVIPVFISLVFVSQALIFATAAHARDACKQSSPVMIYRSMGPPLIIEDGFNACDEAEKRYLKAKRHRQKAAERLAKKDKESEIQIEQPQSDVRQ